MSGLLRFCYHLMEDSQESPGCNLNLIKCMLMLLQATALSTLCQMPHAFLISLVYAEPFAIPWSYPLDVHAPGGLGELMPSHTT